MFFRHLSRRLRRSECAYRDLQSECGDQRIHVISNFGIELRQSASPVLAVNDVFLFHIQKARQPPDTVDTRHARIGAEQLSRNKSAYGTIEFRYVGRAMQEIPPLIVARRCL